MCFFIKGGHVEVAFHNTQKEVPSQLRDFVECGHRSLIVWHSFIETKGTHYKDGADYCVVLHRVNFFFLRFRHQVPFIRVKKPSLGWKRGGKKRGGEGR